MNDSPNTNSKKRAHRTAEGGSTKRLRRGADLEASPDGGMDSTILTDLSTTLTEWKSLLQQVAAKFPNSETVPMAVGRQTPTSVPKDEVVPKTETGTKKMNAKHGSIKAKFSSITGPDIYYDGGSQKLFFECWTVLNNKRGVLRKEIRLLWQKKVHTLPTANYGNSDNELEADDELEADNGLEADDELEADDTLERRDNEKKSKMFEYIDGCLDKAKKACENAAVVWLKGEGCEDDVKFITAWITQAMQMIETSSTTSRFEGKVRMSF
ncbi:hypothetical protein BDD12DRAFT_811245 [Trichophaea hybrida]|nr:hypothetical protein BDD12DRAFT_811245 [Trichophaea hybrida]